MSGLPMGGHVPQTSRTTGVVRSGGRRRLHLAMMLALATTVAACSTGRSGDPFSGRATSNGLAVVVENHAWTDMEVYAVSGGGKLRLGNVTSGRTARFRVRTLADHVLDVELFADPLASHSVYRSGRFTVMEGQAITWTIHESDLGGTVTVR